MADDLDVEALLEAPYRKTPHNRHQHFFPSYHWETARRDGWEKDGCRPPRLKLQRSHFPWRLISHKTKRKQYANRHSCPLLSLSLSLSPWNIFSFFFFFLWFL
ncbi:unnamed protein product [Ixodes pacificus]